MSTEQLFTALVTSGTLAGGLYVCFVVLPRTKKRLKRAVRVQGIVDGFVALNASGAPRVRYRDAQGVERTVDTDLGVQSDSKPDGRVYAIGDTVRLRYDQDDPEWVALDGVDPLRTNRFLAFVLLGMGAMGLWMLAA